MSAPDLGELIVELLAPALRHRETEVEDIVIRPPGGPIPWGTDPGLQIEKNKAFTDPEAAGASARSSCSRRGTAPSPTSSASGSPTASTAISPPCGTRAPRVANKAVDARIASERGARTAPGSSAWRGRRRSVGST